MPRQTTTKLKPSCASHPPAARTGAYYFRLGYFANGPPSYSIARPFNLERQEVAWSFRCGRRRSWRSICMVAELVLEQRLRRSGSADGPTLCATLSALALERQDS